MSSHSPGTGPSEHDVSLANLPEAVKRTRPHRGERDADAFLRAVVRLGASDLHLKSGHSPRLRIDGTLRKVDEEAQPTEQFERNVLAFLTEHERQQLLQHGSVDFAYELGHDVRFRINVFRQESGLSVAARVVPRDVPSFEELKLPPVVAELVKARQGLVLVAGMTGSGKSTTLAALIEGINRTRYEHVLTIEDPIEFLFASKRALINQREIGLNVKDYRTALRALLREDPDVVLIGEMRDAETVRAALQAADTGHLVLSTVHASNAPQTISRLLSLFPSDEHDTIRQSLVFSLRAVVAQKLVRSLDEPLDDTGPDEAATPGGAPVRGTRRHRVPMVEVLVTTPIVRKLIAEERESELADVIRTGEEGMQNFVQSLVSLHNDGWIDEVTGRLAAPNPDEFNRLLAGIVNPGSRLV